MLDILLHPISIIVIKTAVILGVVLFILAYTTLAERRVAGFIQMRLGPNRVGPFGLFQPIADGVKNFFKEDIIPDNVNKVMYVLAPILILVPALMTFAVIPFGNKLVIAGKEISLVIADLDIGVLFVFAMTGMGIYGIVVGGWSSNNKYSLLGGLRAAAQLISYELPLGFAFVAVFMATGTFKLREIVETMAPHWWAYFILLMPTFILFTISSFAETNRLPFDLPECEQELVGGYHTEYSSMKFAMYFMAEYAFMIAASCMTVLLFLGGWYLPWITKWSMNFSSENWLVQLIVGLIPTCIFLGKVLFMLFVFIWVRWTLPRFRYDRLMSIGWKALLPLSFANILFVGLVVIIIRAMGGGS